MSNMTKYDVLGLVNRLCMNWFSRMIDRWMEVIEYGRRILTYIFGAAKYGTFAMETIVHLGFLIPCEYNQFRNGSEVQAEQFINFILHSTPDSQCREKRAIVDSQVHNQMNRRVTG